MHKTNLLKLISSDIPGPCRAVCSFDNELKFLINYLKYWSNVEPRFLKVLQQQAKKILVHPKYKIIFLCPIKLFVITIFWWTILCLNLLLPVKISLLNLIFLSLFSNTFFIAPSIVIALPTITIAEVIPLSHC